MTFGEVLKAQMDAHGMKAIDLAEKSGVYRSYISRLVTGETKDPAFQKAAAIVAALGMSIDEFVSLMDDDAPNG